MKVGYKFWIWSALPGLFLGALVGPDLGIAGNWTVVIIASVAGGFLAIVGTGLGEDFANKTELERMDTIYKKIKKQRDDEIIKNK